MQGGLHLFLEQFVFLSLGGEVVCKDHRLEGGCTHTHAQQRAQNESARDCLVDRGLCVLSRGWRRLEEKWKKHVRIIEQNTHVTRDDATHT